MKKIRGYKIDSKNISKVYQILSLAQQHVEEAAVAGFHQLLSEEITELVDNIALNVIPRPEDPILAVAYNRLMSKINYSEANSFPIEYNLYSGVSIYPERDATYLIFIGGEDLEHAFAETEGIQNYNVEYKKESDDPIMSEREAKWRTIMKHYDGKTPNMRCDFHTELSVQEDLLRFESPSERAVGQARRTITNSYINMYGFGKQIAPEDFMEANDRALYRSVMDEDSERMISLRVQLTQILPEITLDLIRPKKEEPTSQEDKPIIGKE